MMKPNTKSSLPVLAMVVAANCLLPGADAFPADRFDSAREVIRQTMIDTDAPSVAVAVAHKGRILWEQGFGWADKERRVIATEHTLYSLASLTKPLTAAGIMTLVQAGKIDLERPINDYLGAAKLQARVGDARQATVRRVIDHTSGLPGGSQFFYGEERALVPSMERSILRYGNLMAPAGERYEYSNFGYGVLSYVIERVSGRSYADYMRVELFLPLAMTHSSIGVGAGLEQYQAIRYDRTGQPIPDYAFGEPGAAAGYSSAHDLIRLGLFFLKHPQRGQRAILSDSSIDRMLLAGPGANEISSGNVGWEISQIGQRTMVGHAGSMAGVTTELTMVPAEDMSVVVLSNASIGSKVYKIRDAIYRSLLPDWQGTVHVPGKPESFVPTPELLGAWSGRIQTYEGELPIKMNVLAGGDVHVQIGSQLETLLNKVSFAKGVLSGSTLSQIDTSDTRRHPHTVQLTLTLRGDVLNGDAMAVSVPDPKWTWIYGLPHWVELSKQAGTSR